MEQMTAIAAPEEAQADLDTYNEQTLAIVDVIEEQAAAAQDEDQAAFQAGFAEIDTLTAERAQTAAALGFEKCGLAATTASDSEGSEGANEPID
jgi:protoheme ferro-lyase